MFVVPGEPYVSAIDGDVTPATFGQWVVTLELLVVGSKGTNVTAAEEIDTLTQTVMDAVSAAEYGIVSVAQPGTVELNGSGFLATMIRIECLTTIGD